MRRHMLWLATSLLIASPAFAQTPLTLAGNQSLFTPATFVNRAQTPAPPAPASAQTSGRGFTIFATAGFGIQSDSGFEETGTGIAGINLGAGWFLTDQIAVLFRISGTRVKFENLGDLSQSAGVIGGTVQYWLTDRVNVEGGAGIGFWRTEGADDQGFGIILAASGVVWRSGNHHVIVGGEFSRAFTDSANVNNFGITGGYLFRR
jgi:hypothetical protein